MKTTQTQWNIEENREEGIFNNSYQITAPDDDGRGFEGERLVICRLPTGTGQFSEQLPNAQLIAAAPELLTALETLLELAETIPQPATHDGLTIAGKLANARAIVSKAKGNP